MYLRRYSLYLAILISLALNFGCGQEKQSTDTQVVHAFVNVNMVTMDKERIVENQTVIVRGERIESVGDSGNVETPSDEIVINCAGKYLMPGLVDMHAHVEHEDALILFLANGVTTIRNMWGTPSHLVWKDRIQKGEIIGPTIYTAGPVIDGPPGVWDGSIVLDNPADVEQLVLKHIEQGYDYLKVYYLKKEVFKALIAAAKRYDIPVIGHVSDDVGIEGVLASGQYTIEHLDGYSKMLEADDSPFRSDTFDYHSYIMTWNHIDESKMPAAAALTKSSGVWNCPTLVVYQRNASPAQADSLYALPEMQYMDPVSLASWDPATYFVTMNLTAEEWEADHMAYLVLTRFTGYLHKAGARLLLGTDTPNPFVVPGFSIQTELQNFIKAGMTPYEAIKTGTYNAAECLGELDHSGTIAAGKRADLILLNENPLEDVGNITDRVGVMARGRWFSEEELQGRLEQIAASYRPPPDRFDSVAEIDSRGSLIQESRYKLKYNGIPFGEERYCLYALDGDSYELISQTVTDRPYSTETTAKMTLDSAYRCNHIEYLNITSTGSNSLTFIRDNDSLQIKGELKGGAKIMEKKPISQDEFISPPRALVCVSDVPIVASYLQLSKQFEKMEIGDSLAVKKASLQLVLPFGVVEETFSVKRHPDSEQQFNGEIIPIRVFSCIISLPHMEVHSTLSADLKGRVVSLEIEQQIGNLSFHLAGIE